MVLACDRTSQVQSGCAASVEYQREWDFWTGRLPPRHCSRPVDCGIFANWVIKLFFGGFWTCKAVAVFFMQGTHLLHNTLEIVIKTPVSQTLADSGPLTDWSVVILDLPKKMPLLTFFYRFLPPEDRSEEVSCAVWIFMKKHHKVPLCN